MELRDQQRSSKAAPSGEHGRVEPTMARLLRDRLLQAQVRQGMVPEPEWRDALHAICEEARAQNVVPEQLLVEVKQALGILCDTYKVPPGPARTEFTSRVVTICIEEYYAVDAIGDGTGQPTHRAERGD